MTPFDDFVVVDWSAGKRAPVKPSKDAIWIGIVQRGVAVAPVYCRTRQEAEQWITQFIQQTQAAGRRALIGFDFPFGYPKGVSDAITGSSDPFALWEWLADRIQDAADGTNNRFDVAQNMNAILPDAGPFWGKTDKDKWPGIPYYKKGIAFDRISEWRDCDRISKAASSCFQLAFPPTVGSQMLMGLPVLHRLRRTGGVGVWPFEHTEEHAVVLAEIWPGLIEDAVKQAQEPGEIRDRAQVRLLARALSRLEPEALQEMLNAAPEIAKEEAWILGAGHHEQLSQLALSVAPRLKNDCFALPAGVHWTPVSDALAHLRHHLPPVALTEEVPLTTALGRIAAQDVQALRANPPLPNTAVDGYGFLGGRMEGEHRLPLAQGRAAAGDVPGAVAAGQAVRILTGAALPQGVDTVVLQEDVILEDGHVHFRGPIKHGANTRRAGEDVTEGQVILKQGARIGPAELAILSATGVSCVKARRPLRVGVLSTGDELIQVGSTARDGQIYDANRPMLLGLMQQFGYRAIDLGQAPDRRDALRGMLDDAAQDVDAILTSGGASAGDEDHVSALLTQTGSAALWRIAIKPGRPLALGLWQGVPVFGLPGNPVAALVCSLVFARPALAQLGGADWSEPQGFDVPAAFTKSKKPGRREYLRARIKDGKAEVFTSEGSGRISGLSWADGLIELPEPALDVRPGDLVRYIPYSSFGMT